MAALTQEGRKLRITTPLGKDVLVPVKFTGTETLSKPYLFIVDFVSENAAVDASKLLGKEVTLHVDRPDEQVRHIHGLVRRFTSLGSSEYLSRYRAEIVPALWFLSLSSDCRTFEKKTAIDVVEEVCKASGVTAISKRITGLPDERDYIVQYRETNLDFVSRLLEEVGVYYTFEHADGSHKLVLADSWAGSIPACDVPQIRVDSNMVGDRPQDDTVFSYTREFAVHTAKISLRDHDLLRVDSLDDAESIGPHARGERFEFLGDLGLDQSDVEAVLRIQEEERDYEILQGKSSCVALQSGTRAKMVEGPPDISDKEFLIVEVRHSMEGGDVHSAAGLASRYENEFIAIPVATRFRPARQTPRPSIRGTQVAKVVGAGLMDVDAAGRVLLKFPWDRGAGKDGKSTHRVHVASVWGGVKWGFVQIPRIDQEVLVEYLEGDIDRPLITGRVYNAQHKHPYDLPANKTQTGWKSQTLDGGANNFNEIRFDDKKGSEHIFMQAERDLNVEVKHDETRKVEHDRITTIKGHDTHTVSKHQTVKVEQGNQATTISTGNRTVTVEKGNDTLAVEMGNISIKADMGKISIEAMQKIELKVGSNTITIDMTGVTIKGLNVKSEAQAMAEMKGTMTKVEGSAMLQAKAPMTQVNGDGMLMLKGGITMIN